MNMNSMTSWFNNVGSQLSRLTEVVGVLPDSDDDGTYDKVKKKEGDGAATEGATTTTAVPRPDASSSDNIKGELNDASEEGAKPEDDAAEAGDGGGDMPVTASIPDLTAVQDNLKNFGGLLTRFADKATKQVSQTAQQVKQKVEENTIFGEFQREQERFIAEQLGPAASTSAQPPWAGCADETALKKQILSLSLDSRNFLRDPPAGTQFQFDYSVSQPVAEATLLEDPNLMKMRFALVPKDIAEEVFWRNYFYRVSLITQSMQLKNFNSTENKPGLGKTTSTPPLPTGGQQGGSGGVKSQSSDPTAAGGQKPSTGSSPPLSPSMMSPPDSAQPEFLSDAVQTEVNESELQQVREALGLGYSFQPGFQCRQPDGIWRVRLQNQRAHEEDWERELVAELNDYEMVKGAKPEEEWEKEITDLLDSEMTLEDAMEAEASAGAAVDPAKELPAK